MTLWNPVENLLFTYTEHSLDLHTFALFDRTIHVFKKQNKKKPGIFLCFVLEFASF